MKIFRNIVILLMLVTLSVYLCYVFVFVSSNNGERVCSGIEVRVVDSKKHTFVSVANVEDSIRAMRRNILGSRFEQIDFQEIEQRVARNPFVEEVMCYPTANNVVRIDVTQRTPVLRFVKGNAMFYVDKHRKVMPSSVHHSVYVPLVTGIFTQEFLLGELYDCVTKIQNDAFWANQITQIDVSPSKGVVLVPRAGNHTVVLGTLDNVDAKLAKLLKFYNKVLPAKGWNLYSQIDLRYKNQVVCTRRGN